MEAKKTSNHENLSGTNSMTVRQNRFESEGQLHVEANGIKFKLVNYSLFGVGILSSEEIKTGTYLPDVSLHFGNQKISEHSFVVKRSKKGDHGFEIGLEIQNQTIPVETIMRVKDFNSLVSSIDEKRARFKILPEKFKFAIIELAARLESYEKYTLEFSKKDYNKSRDYQESRKSLVDIVSNQLRAELFETTEGLKQFVSDFSDGDKLKCAFAFFRESLGQFLFQSPFSKRSFEKPRGYAGDFEMMSQIYANDGFAHSIFGSCIERAVQSFGEPTAVRNRSVYLCEKLKYKIANSKGKLKFLSVASGPAEEVRLLIEILPQSELERCTFSLLDQDEGALQFAQRNIKEHSLKNGKTINLNLINKGIKEVIIAGLPEDSYDMIYSAGLFDYFSDPVATKACKQLYKSLKKSGDLVIGNFNITTTNWFGMIALFDWTLILRSEADFKRLFDIEGSRMTVESESNNINLFCCIKS